METSDAIHFLIIDDDEVDILLCVRALQKYYGEKARIDTAETGEQGVQLCQKQAFDCIFIDYRLPGENGLEVLHKIQAHGEKKPLIFMLSGQDDPELTEAAIQNGATGFILKDENLSTHLIQSLKEYPSLRR